MLSTESSVVLNKERFKKFGIDHKILKQILEINTRLHILDKGFKIEDEKLVYNKEIDLYNVLKSYMMSSVDEKKYNDLVANLGKEFEKYIRNNLVEEFKGNGRYKIYCGSIDYKKDDVNVDIDIVIFDNQRNLYYFIQCKYTIYNKPYFKDEIKSFCGNKLFKDGLKQLAPVKDAIHQKEFIETLDQMGIKLNPNKDNYILILVHPAAQLDFQQVGDITLYEWNTLRNLLKNGQELICNINLISPTTQVNNMSSKLKLENVDSVVDSIFRSSTKDYKSDWNKFINSSFEIKLGDIHIVSNIR